MSSSVGTLALGIVGGVIGSFVGQPALGFMIGSALGSALFAPSTKIEGPRIGDTEVQSSSLGVVIPYQFGTTRSSGQVLWSGGLKEKKKKDKQGKGGGGSTTITYSYSSSFLVSFGWGPAVSLRRIWADGKLIYDTTGTGDVKNDKYKFRFYKGDGTTTVDSLVDESINRRLAGMPDVNQGNGPQATFTTMANLKASAQAACDAGDNRACIIADGLTARADGPAAITFNEPVQYYWHKGPVEQKYSTRTVLLVPDHRFSPSYKYFCHIVFDDMKLEDFGNRIPNITAEIIWGTTSQVITISNEVAESPVAQISPTVTAPTNLAGIYPVGRKVAALSGTTLRLFDGNTNTEKTFLDDITFSSVVGADIFGNFLVSTGSAVVRCNSLTLTPEGTGGTFGAYGAPSYGAILYDDVTSNVTLSAVVNSSGNVGILRTDGTVQLVWGDTVADSSGFLDTVSTVGAGPMCYGGTSDATGTTSGDHARVLMFANDGTNWVLYAITAQYQDNGTGLILYAALNTIATGLLGTMTMRNVVYDSVTDRALLFFEDGGAGVVKKYTMTGVEIFSGTTTYPAPGAASGFQHTYTSGGSVAYATDNDITQINILTGEETVNTNILTSSASATAQTYNSLNDSIFTWYGTVPTVIFLNRSSDGTAAGSTLLASIVNTICEKSGLEASEFDTSGISTDWVVHGFTIARASSGRQALEKLLAPWTVDGVEVDWAIRFSDRTTSPYRTISEDELGIVQGPTGDIHWLQRRTPDYEIPQEITLTYIDNNKDYQTGAARAQRISQPVNTMFSVTKESIELPMVLSEKDAQAAATRLLYLRWLSRDSAKTTLSWKHIDIDPVDLLRFSFDDGVTYQERLTKVTMGADYTLDVEMVHGGDPVHVQKGILVTGVTDATSNVPNNSIKSTVPTYLFVLDIPLLYDFHDTGRTSIHLYTAAGADSDQWTSAYLYASSDGVNFNDVTSFDTDISWATVVGTVPAPRTLWTIDMDTTITIKPALDNGDIVSITMEEFINTNMNRAIIYNPSSGVSEIIAYRDVVENVDGSFTLSYLMRGLRGTDYAVDQHTSGAQFLLIADAAVIGGDQELGVLESTQYFKGVSAGASIAGTLSKSLLVQGRSLMPWAPNNMQRSDDGTDLTITWTRRTRVGGDWNMVGAGVEPVPLSEDFEQYEIYILPAGDFDTQYALFDPDDAATYAIKHDEVSSTSVFTAAELSGASLTLADRFNIVVYQISGQVGRGFPGKAALAE